MGVRVWVVYLTPKIERIIVLLSASPEGEARLPMPKGMAYKELLSLLCTCVDVALSAIMVVSNIIHGPWVYLPDSLPQSMLTEQHTLACCTEENVQADTQQKPSTQTIA
jgi:hypothetical protein